MDFLVYLSIANYLIVILKIFMIVNSCLNILGHCDHCKQKQNRTALDVGALIQCQNECESPSELENSVHIALLVLVRLSDSMWPTRWSENTSHTSIDEDMQV